MTAPKRRWFQFRLRTLFVVVSAVRTSLAVGYRALRSPFIKTAVLRKDLHVTM
jgi:hypothetical protein